mgnify:FL=1
MKKKLRSFRFSFRLFFLLPFVLAACNEAEVSPANLTFAETFQEQLINAKPGDILNIPAGIHAFSRSLSLSVPGVTLRGKGINSSILSFKTQSQGAEGLLVSANDFTIEDLAIEDTKGDALKINQSRNVTIRRVRTEWTNGASTENGAYGIYPVQSENILIEGSVAIGASDAGIYVGQSKNIVVRDSRAEYNVAGIEIENSTHADVYRNVATKNTGGILVFDLPNLPVQGGQATRVFNNDIYSNNTENFAPEGNIVGNVPTGTGLLILANDNIEVFENRFADNGNVNIMIYSFLFGGRQIDDTKYDPYPEKIYIYNNDFDGGGDRPRHPALIAWAKSNPLGTPDVVWDGMVRRGNGQENIVCLGENATENLLNLGGTADVATSHLALDSHRCTFDLLDPIEL